VNMFDNLTDKLQNTFRNFTGRGILSEGNIDEAMRDVRLALLDADVNHDIVKDFVDEVRAECLGEKVGKSIKPGQQAIKIVSDKLTDLMGAANVPLELKGFPGAIMMVGLHGSGKTTTTAKLAANLARSGKRVLMVAADVYRPAAIDQLEILGREIDIPVYADRETQDVAAIGAAARNYARHHGHDTLILDTAGRFQFDEVLVAELVKLKTQVPPNEILLVADAALGQEAVSVARQFNEALDITGIILTKLDGDARGGAALSMRRVTGKPIKFFGIGEKIDDLEAFYPDRMANRILGMGDVVSLVERVEEKINVEEAEKLEQKMLKNQFDLEDFMNVLRQLKNLGGMGKVLEMLPGARQLMANSQVDERVLSQNEAIISSMTPHERQHPEVLSAPSRRDRISKGSGRAIVEVVHLLKRFEAMRKLMSNSNLAKMARMMGLGEGDGGGAPDFAGAPGMTAGDLMNIGGAPFMRGGGQNRTISQKAKKARRKKNKK